MGESPASASFLREVRRALYHLYDPAELRSSPLVVLLGLEQRGDPPASLRRALLEAIEALKPGAGVPPQSNAWRIYQVLSQRFAEQFTQREVATDLALSIRQLRRQEHVALHVLADYLWNRYDLDHRPAEGLEAERAGGAPAAEGGNEGTPSREQELEWLRKSAPTEAVDVAELISAVLRIVSPLMQSMGVHGDYEIPEDLPPATVQVTTMRQALLNLFTAAIRRVPGGRVCVEAARGERDLLVCVRPLVHPAASQALTHDDQESLEMARQLVALSGGALQVVANEDGTGPYVARLVLPAVAQMVVLVIDDNTDTLQLLQRYLAGTRYRFVGSRDPEEGLRLAEELTPKGIVLDVMLPGIDGWELLGRLREHPRTRSVPVIVCTILPQERLALTLGAAEFIRKPVGRGALLAALDRQLGPSSRGSA
jgi:CheY-like chemotaxis protein